MNKEQIKAEMSENIGQLENPPKSVGLESEDLEKAADNHIHKVVDDGWEWETQDIVDAFKAGARWQKEQMIGIIESRIAEILGDAQPAPILRYELQDIIGRIKED